MPLLASFNYYPPTPLAIVIGVLLGLAFLVLAGFSRRVLVGVPVTMFAWAVIASGVCYQGNGDMTIIMMMFFGGALGLAGAVVGGVAAYICKLQRQASVSDKLSDRGDNSTKRIDEQ